MSGHYGFYFIVKMDRLLEVFCVDCCCVEKEDFFKALNVIIRCVTARYVSDRVTCSLGSPLH